ncbi:DNA-3-methyladenine glycosylase [Candidatus Cerribacteria bacterium 'Amazon FNV 2010 28 9']|uniref:Putative 3-methyladenine DNA glycosylase n=1 Tax=Candidatus Cerribacteria bacterium 'Amazon FNV 2010 28 9' TaxID=2081795 RepID=A0A317JNK5_9BACT|nr:MAG: DNA-3-methyladenine glycosylase [Candidatus Cerribacteria bacterium 'Amazon FNV 2010 28 9']
MKLPRAFYERSPLEVAPELLGKFLVHVTPEGTATGQINEVEIYSQDDPASHTFRGKTPRNAVMFGKGGFAYVYFTYGMYFCMNVSTETEGIGSGVLIRSCIPVEGIGFMQQRRGKSVHLCDGPGKLCQAFGLTREHNGIDLTTSAELFIEDRGVQIEKYTLTPRIGISVATDKLWRFVF